MSWAQIITASGPVLFAVVFLAKGGYLVGQVLGTSKQSKHWSELDATVKALKKTVSKGFGRVTEQISNLRDELTDIRESYVAKGECKEIHNRLEDQQSQHEERISELEREMD